MPSPDQLFRLDPLETKLTDTQRSVVAQGLADTSDQDAQLISGLQSFGKAIGSAADYAKKRRIDEDIKLAENAALRNEEMPNRLLPIAQDAWTKIYEFNEANDKFLEYKTWTESEEVSNVIDSLDIPASEKIDYIDHYSKDLLQRSLATFSNPLIAQKHKTRIEELQQKVKKDIYKVEDDVMHVQAIKATANQIDEAVEYVRIENIKRRTYGATLLKYTDIFTGNWIDNNSKDWGKLFDKMSPQEKKLVIFKTLTANEDILGSPSVIDNLMKQPFNSKGFTYGHLYSGKGKDAEEFKKIYDAYQIKSAAYFKQINDDNKASNDLRDKRINEAVLDLIAIGGNGQQAADLAKQHGETDIAKLNKIQTSVDTYIENRKHTFDSPEGQELLKSIYFGTIAPNEADVKLAMIEKGIDLRDFKQYSPYIEKEKNQTTIAFDKHTKAIKTVNGQLVSLLNKSLNVKMTLDIHTGEVNIEAFRHALFKKGVSSQRQADLLGALQSIRDVFDSRATQASRKAAIENKDPDISKFTQDFNDEISKFLRNVESGKPPFFKEVPELQEGDESVGTGITAQLHEAAFHNKSYIQTNNLIRNPPEYVNEVTKDVTEFLKDPDKATKIDKEYIEKIAEKNPDAVRQTILQETLKSLSDPQINQLDKEMAKYSVRYRVLGEVSKPILREEKPTEKAEEIHPMKRIADFFQELEKRGERLIDFLDEASIFDDKPAIKHELKSNLQFLDAVTPNLTIQEKIDLFKNPPKEDAVPEKVQSLIDKNRKLTESPIEPAVSKEIKPSEVSPKKPSLDTFEVGKPTGRITTEGRPELKNNQGGTSTEYTIGVKDSRINNGALTHIPSIYDGKILRKPNGEIDEERLIQIVVDNNGTDKETGRHLPSETEPGGNPEERSKSITFDKEGSEKLKIDDATPTVDGAEYFKDLLPLVGNEHFPELSSKDLFEIGNWVAKFVTGEMHSSMGDYTSVLIPNPGEWAGKSARERYLGSERKQQLTNRGIGRKIYKEFPESMKTRAFKREPNFAEFKKVLKNYLPDLTFEGQEPVTKAKVESNKEKIDRLFNEIDSLDQEQADLIKKVAKETGGDPKVLKAILMLETSLGKNIKESKAGARGIAQFMPATAKGMVKNYPKIFKSAEKIMTDNEEGIKAASVLIERELLPEFKNTDYPLKFAFARYNSSRKSMAKARKLANNKNKFADVLPHLPTETRDYIQKANKLGVFK